MTDHEAYLALLDILNPQDRERFLDRLCAGDTERRGRILAQLAENAEVATFIQHAVVSGPLPTEPGAPLPETAPALELGGELSPPRSGDAPTSLVDPTADPEGTLIGGLGSGTAWESESCQDARETPTLIPESPGEQADFWDSAETSFPKGTPGFAGQGTVIAGRYTLVGVIGEGGMGSVYRARQTQPVRRDVALKLIKSGLDSRSVLARFDAERQALAVMDHPNIARVFDGGTTPTGQPFFVMELVQGVSLTEYCDARKLTVNERLRLFSQVCHAVQHAHQKGIIHRDLKPGNILVTEVDGRPTPKVIDFGVAKATEQSLTDMSIADEGAIVGTPAYMSPEQADPNSIDIDTRTDVYALGVILYELLVGSPPLEAKDFKRGAILEMLRMVREVEAPRPSTKLSSAEALPNIAANRGVEPAKLGKLLQGELDWIVLKAIEKDRNRRYDSPNGFAHDIERYLADEPVEARPPSAGYRFQKFVRRNKGRVVAGGLLLLTLIGGIVGTTLGMFAAQDHAEQTQKEVVKTTQALAEREEQRKLAVNNQKTAETNAKLAEENAELANKNFELAEKRLDEVRYNSSLDSILLAQSAFRDGNVDAARERLNRVPPEHRQWEWHYLNRQFEGSLMTLYGHGDQVVDLVFSPDGSQLASVGGYDRTVLIWEVQTGRLLRQLHGHTAAVLCCRYSPDGKILATGGEGETLLWDTVSGELVRSLAGTVRGVCAIRFIGQGERLVTGDNNGKIQIFATATGELIRALPGHASEGENIGLAAKAMLATLGVEEMPPMLRTRLDVTRDGKRILSAGLMLPRIWDVETGRPVRDLPTNTLAISTVSFSPDESQYMIAGDAIRIYDSTNGKLIREFKHDMDGTVAYSPDSQYLISSISSGLRIWDANSGAEQATFFGHTGGAGPVAVHPDGILIASGGADKTVKIWELNGGRPPIRLRASQRSVYAAAWSPDGDLLASASRGAGAVVWDMRDGTTRFPIHDKTQVVSAVAVSPGGDSVVAAGGDFVIRLRDGSTGELKKELKGHKSAVAWMLFSKDGKTLFSAAQDNSLRVWDVESGKTATTLPHQSIVSHLALSQNGLILVACEKNDNGRSCVRVWDTATNQQIRELSHPVLGTFSRVAISPDNRIVYGGCSDRKIYCWELESGVLKQVLEGHLDRLGGMALNHSGTRLVSTASNFDGSAIVWDTRTGRPVVSLRDGKSDLTHVTFDPNSERIAMGSNEGQIRVFDGRPVREPTVLKTGQMLVTTLAWHPNRDELLTAGETGQLQWWDPVTGELLREHTLSRPRATASINSVDFSADGTSLVVAGNIFDESTAEREISSRIQILDTATGTVAREFSKLKLSMEGRDRVGFTQDGTRLIHVSSLRGRLKVLDANTGAILKEDPTLPVGLDVISPDGSRIATIEDGGRVRIALTEVHEADAIDRTIRTRPRPWQHWEQFNRAIDGRLQFAISFHRQILQRFPDEFGLMRSEQAQRRIGVANNYMGMNKYEEAVVEFQRALVADPDNKAATQGLAKAVLDQVTERLTQYRKRERAPGSREDRLALIDLAEKKQFHDTVAELYQAGFKSDSSLTTEPRAIHRIRAARNAILASKSEKVAADEASQWRQQALAWLRDELAMCDALRTAGTADDRAFATSRRESLSTDSDFAPVREADQIAALPEPEREAWVRFWKEVTRTP